MWDDKKNNKISKKWKSTSPPLAFAKNQNMGDKIEKGNWQKQMNRQHGYRQMPKLTKKKILHCWHKL
jgi:hypothetical protein